MIFHVMRCKDVFKSRFNIVHDNAHENEEPFSFKKYRCGSIATA